MRISDWSSDVCSSDLQIFQCDIDDAACIDDVIWRVKDIARPHVASVRFGGKQIISASSDDPGLQLADAVFVKHCAPGAGRSAARPTVKECVSTCRTRWSAYR